MSELLSEVGIPSNLRAPFCASPVYTATGDSLPYHLLDGPSLERLCYLLLLQEGSVPRYFGKPGQKQYGIDILVSNNGQHTVYQCKSVARFGASDLGAALQLFVTEWLGRNNLPTPQRLVICCPLDLRELKFTINWLEWEERLRDEKGIELVCWDRHFLDERLRKLPDLVADLFSVRLVDSFCETPDWNDDLFRPFLRSAGGRTIDRYIDLMERGQIYVDESLADSFSEILDRSGTVLILGPPGSGKTTLGLALSATVDGGSTRIFYLNLIYEFSEHALVAGIKRRLSRRTSFVIDNCHCNFDLVKRILDRLDVSLVDNRVCQLVLLARSAPTPVEALRDDHELIEISRQEGIVIDLNPKLEDFRQIISHRYPSWGDLSAAQLENIYAATARDLALLDQVVEDIDEPQSWADELKPEKIYAQTLRRYFGSNRSFLPGFLSLSAIAQFDVAPLAEIFPLELLERESQRAMNDLVVTAGRPPRHYFLHSSAAELLAQAIAWRHGSEDLAVALAPLIVEYLVNLVIQGKSAVTDFILVFSSHMRLMETSAEFRLKRSIMADLRIYEFFAENFSHFSLSISTECLLRAAESPSADHYSAMFRDRIEDGTIFRALIERPIEKPEAVSGLLLRTSDNLNILRSQLRNIALADVAQKTSLPNILFLLTYLADSSDPWWCNAVKDLSAQALEALALRTVSWGQSFGYVIKSLDKLSRDAPLLSAEISGSSGFMSAIIDSATMVDLFQIIRKSSVATTRDIADLLSEKAVNGLVQRTLLSGRRAGMLYMTLRRLKALDEDLLAILEQKVGAIRFLQLIVQAGALGDLLRFLGSCSHAIAREVISLIGETDLDLLVNRTVDSNKSIGALSLNLRELGITDEGLLGKLTRKLGAHRFFLIVSRVGTIIDLFRLLPVVDSDVANALVALLVDMTLDVLLDRAISNGLSVGTLALKFRALSVSGRAQFLVVEEKIGPARFAKLFVSSGTIVSLVKILEQLSPKMAMEVISLLTEPDLDKLVAKTILSGQSITWLAFSVRQIRRMDRDLAFDLEAKIGASRFLRVIAEVGTFPDLFRFIGYSSPEFARELICLLCDETLDLLVERTVELKCSVGTLSFAIRDIKRESREVAELLEVKVGVDRLWYLTSAVGNFQSLASMTAQLSFSMRRTIRQRLAEASIEDLQSLIIRSNFVSLARFARYPAHEPPAFTKDQVKGVKPMLDAIVERESWEALYSGNSMLIGAQGSPFRECLVASLQGRLANSPPVGILLGSLPEAVSYAALLWEQSHLRTEELARVLLSMLPDSEKWLTEPRFLRLIGCQLTIIAFREAPYSAARRMLDLCASQPVEDICAGASALDCFLFLWNVYSVWYAWHAHGSLPKLKILISGRLVKIFHDVVCLTAQRGVDPIERDASISLAGLLNYIDIPVDGKLRGRWMGRLPAFEDLLEVTLEKRFVPGFFFSLGLEWVFGQQGRISRLTWQKLLLCSRREPLVSPAFSGIQAEAFRRSRS